MIRCVPPRPLRPLRAAPSARPSGGRARATIAPVRPGGGSIDGWLMSDYLAVVDILEARGRTGPVGTGPRPSPREQWVDEWPSDALPAVPDDEPLSEMEYQ